MKSHSLLRITPTRKAVRAALENLRKVPVTEFDHLLIDAERLWSGEAPWPYPIALVELEKVSNPDAGTLLPACPVIGIGDRAHPVAARLDAVVEDPVPIDTLARQVLARPMASAAIVQLLRILPSLSLDAGLTAESMAYAMLQGSAEHREWLDGRGSASEQEPQAPGQVILDRDSEGLTITLDRPWAGNSIDAAMRDGLHDAFMLAALDTDIEAVSLRANGKTFSLGADLSEFGTTSDPATAHHIRSLTLPARMAVGCAGKLEAHINGACVGAGLEIAAFASRVTARRTAWFQLPELEMGILPGAGGCVSLTRRIGRQRTALMILSGKRISAAKALEWGLIDAIVDDPA